MGQFRAIAVAAQVTQHHPLQAIASNVCNHLRRLLVRQMAMPRKNALFDRPGPPGIVLQHAFIMIGFDNQRMHLANAFERMFRCVTEVGQKSYRSFIAGKYESDRIDRIMWHVETLDFQIFNCEDRPGFKFPEGLLGRVSAINHRFGCVPVAVERDFKSPGQNLETRNMITMFVRNENPVQRLGLYSYRLKSPADLASAQPGINQESAAVRSQKRAISRASTAEHRQTEHS